MKKDEKNLLILIGFVLLLSLFSRQMTVFNISYGGTIVKDEIIGECTYSCPIGYEVCVCRYGPDMKVIPYSMGALGIILQGGKSGLTYSVPDNPQRCLIIGYYHDDYEIVLKEAMPNTYLNSTCTNTPSDIEFCLINTTASTKYQKILIAESPEWTTDTVKAIYYFRVPIPNPPSPSEIDIFAIFNQLFSMVWSALKALFGWLT